MDILLAECDYEVVKNICDYFTDRKTTIEWAPDGLTGLERATACRYDAIILGLELPHFSGVRLCERLRKIGYVDLPIIMISKNCELPEKMRAFQAGVDDYIVIPFAPEELETRILAVNRRSRRHIPTPVISVGELSLNTATREISRAGKSLYIPATGQILLEALMRNTHRVIPRSELEHLVWGEDVPESDCLKIHIYALREIIDKPFGSEMIRNIRGVGYRIVDSAE